VCVCVCVSERSNGCNNVTYQRENKISLIIIIVTTTTTKKSIMMKKDEEGDKYSEDSGSIVAIHVYVTGRVQGVYYRKTAVLKAKRLGVAGWVRNLKDRRVEMMCVGKKDKIKAFVKWMKISGDGAAKDVGFHHEKTKNRRVDRVDVRRKNINDIDIALGSKFVRRKTPP